MGYQYTEKRYNVMGLSSLAEFAHIRGGINGNRQDVYFIRAVGVSENFVREVTEMERELTGRMAAGQVIYNRAGAFPRSIPMEEIQIYTGCYDAWDSGGRKILHTRALGEASGLGELVSTACQKVVDLHRRSNVGVSSSMERNFVSKLLYWADTLAGEHLRQWTPGQCMKFAAQGVIKEQEYLFCYFLTLLGIDVLLLQNERDIDEKLDRLQLSVVLMLGEKKAVPLAGYDKNKYLSPAAGPAETNRPIRVTIPARPGRRSSSSGQAGCAAVVPCGERKGAPPQSIPDTGASGRELTFEELALKASSVVMIALHNDGGEVVGTGSGIMIGQGGYILTNHHVASGGRFYSVRIENDQAVYKTDEIIKYNQVLDLAVIRINRQLQPLPIYRGSRPLVRGQKVVAIGSPLGLFNSVSDGIIAGFRKIRDIDMIQFTAPISSGSSGGAVLNMYGEVIGVSTAGFDDGQNINLAVGYEFIDTFTRGFR